MNDQSKGRSGLGAINREVGAHVAEVGAPVFAAMLVAAVIVSVVPGLRGSGGADSVSVTMAGTPLSSFEDWVPADPDAIGTGQWTDRAPVGTMLYRSCEADEDCSVVLVRADGVGFDLADLHPEAVAAIAEYGMDGAMLSRDATWLGARIGTGYVLFDLVSGDVERVEPGPAGTHWEVVGMGGGGRVRGGITMARYRDGQVVEYRHAWLPGMRWSSYRPSAEQRGLLPVSGGSGTVQVQIPIDTTLPLSKRERVTSFPTDSLKVVPDGEIASLDPDWKQGEIQNSGGTCDLSYALRPDETLAGPRGIPDRDLVAYKAVGGELVPQAVNIFAGCDVEAVKQRLNLPQSTPTEEWTLLGGMSEPREEPREIFDPPDESVGVAMAHHRPGSDMTDIVRVTHNGREVVRSIPFGSDILLPGMIVSSV